KQQRQYRIAKDKPEQDKSEDGIHHAQDNGVGRNGLDIFPAEAQRAAEVGKADLADNKGGRDAKQLQLGPCKYCGHDSGLLARGRRRTERPTKTRAIRLMRENRDVESGKSDSTEKELAGRHAPQPVRSS